MSRDNVDTAADCVDSSGVFVDSSGVLTASGHLTAPPCLHVTPGVDTCQCQCCLGCRNDS